MALIKLPKMKSLWKLNPFKMIKRIRLLPERKKWDKHGPLKVAFYTDSYLPNVDGVVNSIISYSRELERRGNDVFIFTSGSDADSREFGNKKTFFFESVRFPPYPQYKVAIFPFTSYRYAKKTGAHLIHSHAIASMGLASITCAKMLNLPLVGTFHTMVPKAGFVLTRSSIGKRIFSEVAWGAVRQFYAPFDLVTAPTKTIERLLNHNGIENTAVVPNGVDVNKFSTHIDRQLVRKLLGIRQDEKIILTSGRMSEEKNVDVLLRAFAKLLKVHKAKFIIQGDGPAKLKYVKIAKKLGLQKDVIFTGFVKDFEVPFFYAAADVFTTASTFETQGLALLEAMACGGVCVGAKSLAIPEMLHHGSNGYLFRPGDDADCEEKLLKALNLKSTTRNAMSKNARQVAMEYSIERSTDKLLGAYRKVL
ncbi:MAG: glycosyltransferase [Candidatus Micrarchaeota archaeon]